MPLLRQPRHLAPERRTLESVRPLELYFDLVFVLGFTQSTALMHENPTWEGVAHGLLVLAVLWWSWAVFDLELPLHQAAHGYEAMDQRRAIKALLRP